MNVDIAGKTVLITGAAGGIGAGLARRFAAERVQLVLLDRNGAALEQSAAALRGDGATVLWRECDVRDEAGVHDLVGVAVKQFGGVDVLINNAGIAPTGPVEAMSHEDWEDTFSVNVTGVFVCCRAVIPVMKRQRAGRILTASSFAAIIPSYGTAAYAASKSAVVAFTRVLAAELGPWNVTVNAYAPGMVPTSMNRFAEAPPERQQQLLDTLALRRWETADDLASCLIFLSSDAAAYITGALIEISGGKFAVQFPQAAYAAAETAG